MGDHTTANSRHYVFCYEYRDLLFLKRRPKASLQDFKPGRAVKQKGGLAVQRSIEKPVETETKKKTVLSRFVTFLTYGGWILILLVILGLVILFNR